MTSPAPIPTHREYYLAHGPNRAQYLEKFTDAEWWIWMGLGGVMPSRIREKFKALLAKERGAE